MKFDFINKKLSKKIIAGTIIGIISFSGVPKIVYGSTNKSNKNTNSSISVNACYDEVIAEFDTLGGKFKVYKRDNGSYIAQHSGEKFTSYIELAKDGTVKTNIKKKDKNGSKTFISETFKIKTFTGDSIEIAKDCINNKDMKKCIKAFENYINGTNINGVNYLKELKSSPNQYNKDKASEQLLSLYAKMQNDLNNYDLTFLSTSISNADMSNLYTASMVSDPSLITELETGLLALASIAEAVTAGNIITIIVASSIIPIVLYYATTQDSFRDSLSVVTGVAGKTVSKGKSKEKDSISISIPQQEKKYINIGGETILAVSLGTLLDGQSMTKVTFDDIGKIKQKSDSNKNKNEKDKDKKIYYRVVFNGEDHLPYINLLSPMTIDEAAKYLQKSDVVKDKNGEIDPYNIYTFNPEDAVKLIQHINSTPWVPMSDEQKKRLNTGQYLAENHAFADSYSSYFEFGASLATCNLKFTEKTKPGIQFWHFHLEKKKYLNYNSKNTDTFGNLMPKSETNNKHVFFGIPVYITQNDINRFGTNKTFCITDLDMLKLDTYKNKVPEILTEFITNKDFYIAPMVEDVKGKVLKKSK